MLPARNASPGATAHTAIPYCADTARDAQRRRNAMTDGGREGGWRRANPLYRANPGEDPALGARPPESLTSELLPHAELSPADRLGARQVGSKGELSDSATSHAGRCVIRWAKRGRT